MYGRIANFISTRLWPMYSCKKDLDGCEMLERISKGEATKDEINMLGDVTNQIAGHTICAFGEGSSWPVQGLLRHLKVKLRKEII